MWLWWSLAAAVCSLAAAARHPCGQITFDAPQGGHFPGRNYRWAVSLCKPLAEHSICQAAEGNWVEQQDLEDGLCDDEVGRLKGPPAVTQTKAGWRYVYTSPDPTNMGGFMEAVVDVTCEPGSGPGLRRLASTVEVSEHGPLGFSFAFPLASNCKADSGGWGWQFLFTITCLGGLYASLGFLYNTRVRGLPPAEAFPQKEFWKDVPQLCQGGFCYAADATQDWAARVRGRGYEDVC
eukprot:EG_transcript_22763